MLWHRWHPGGLPPQPAHRAALRPHQLRPRGHPRGQASAGRQPPSPLPGGFWWRHTCALGRVRGGEPLLRPAFQGTLKRPPFQPKCCPHRRVKGPCGGREGRDPGLTAAAAPPQERGRGAGRLPVLRAAHHHRRGHLRHGADQGGDCQREWGREAGRGPATRLGMGGRAAGPPAPVGRCVGLTSPPIPPRDRSWLLKSLAGGWGRWAAGTWQGAPRGGPLAAAGRPSGSTRKVSHMEKAQGHRRGGGRLAQADLGPVSPSAPSISTPSSSLAPQLCVPGSISLAAFSTSPPLFLFLCVSPSPLLHFLPVLVTFFFRSTPFCPYL